MSESEIEIRVVIDSGTGTKFLQRNTFIVKEYQRGYRWEPSQVVALLEDIYEFDTQNNVLRYCLQPLVVKKCAPLNDGNRLSKKLSCQTYATGEEDTIWELIDGQQRLTTVLLILATCYEGKSNKLPYDIVYANNRSEIDDYYIDKAKETIQEWFKRFGELWSDDVRYELQRKIHSYIQFIWYQVPDGAKSNEIFTKLNMGKIPLTNAELFKALLLSSDGAQCNNNSGESQRDKIAVEWDFVEQSLHDDNFWYFISNEDSPVETRIDYLLKLFALTNVNNSAVQGKKLIKSDRLFSFLVVSAIIDQAKAKGKNNNELTQISQELYL